MVDFIAFIRQNTQFTNFDTQFSSKNTSLVAGDVFEKIVNMAISKVNFGLPSFCFFKREREETTYTKVKEKRSTVEL